MALIDDVKQLVANVTGTAADELFEESSIETVEAWDSMAHVNIILSLEQNYGLSIGPDEAADLTGIAAIRDYLQQKTGA